METELSQATEKYLRTIFDLHEDRVTPRRARISSRQGHSKSAVSQKIDHMRLAGLVSVTHEGLVVLTDSGLHTATALTRKQGLVHE